MIFLAVVMKSQENATYHSGFFIDFSYFYQKFAVHRIANAKGVANEPKPYRCRTGACWIYT